MTTTRARSFIAALRGRRDPPRSRAAARSAGSAYASKSKSSSEIALLDDAPHRLAEVRHEPHERGARARPRRRPRRSRPASSSSFSSSSSSWLTEKFARSKKRSPMPAYSQSTIRSRSPSAMKFAFSRSLWQGAGGCAPRARSISVGDRLRVARSRPAIGDAVRGRGRAVGLDDAERVEPRRRTAAPSWKRRSVRATSRRRRARASRSSAIGAPSTKRVTR